MKNFINATDESGNEFLVNPEDIQLNKAGTNMSVGVYCEKCLDKGDKACHRVWFRQLVFDPKDKETMEKLFLQEKQKIKKKIKNKDKRLRRKREKVA